jgi:predicted nucleic acid-binding OB-fold protein
MRTCVYGRYAKFSLEARSFNGRAFQLEMLPIVLAWTTQRTKSQKRKRQRFAWARQIKNSIKPVLRSSKPH